MRHLVAVCAAAAFVVAGCAEDGDGLAHLAECADLAFPEGAEVVRYESDAGFRVASSVAVVDIPADAVAEFARSSGLPRFEPGVPASWLSYWSGPGEAEMLAGPGNEHGVEGYRDPRRYVVVHDNGGTARVFVRAEC